MYPGQIRAVVPVLVIGSPGQKTCSHLACAPEVGDEDAAPVTLLEQTRRLDY
jgi:hypothetical protein